MGERRNGRNRRDLRVVRTRPASSLAVENLVVAARDISEGFKLAKRGAVGVVTHVFAHGLGYEVRFFEPSRVTLRAGRDEIEPA